MHRFAHIAYILVGCCLFMVSSSVAAQTGCQNGQGRNIFSNGDFGSGVNNILQTDPGIAPGYMYTTNPPPDDGFYIITNNTSPWGSFAVNWIDIGDRSGSPLGYMMVINASFDPGIFYRQVVQVCEGTTYQFSADIINLLEPSLPTQILPNVDFLVDGNVLFSTGNIPQNGTWASVGFSFVVMPGQNNITLELRNNAPGGDGNDLAIDNISFFLCGPNIQIDAPNTICPNGDFDITANLSGGDFVTPFFLWQRSIDGITWIDIPGANGPTITENVDTDMFYRLFVADGSVNINQPTCRLMSDVIQVLIQSMNSQVSSEICMGDSVVVGDSAFYDSGDYVLILMSSMGCDSIVELMLTVFDTSVTFIFDSICAGADFNGEIYFESQSFSDTFPNAMGCDSFVFTELFVDQVDLIMPNDITIDQGATATLVASASGNIVQWNWTPDEDLSCNDCPVTDANPNITTSYSLTAINAQGCTDTGTVTVTVIFDQDIYIPNAFSPNDDAINDTFFPFTHGNINLIKAFRIFNRWGGQVFAVENVPADNSIPGWNGTVNGKNAGEGLYVYQATFTAIDGSEIELAGEVLLIR